MSVQATSWVWDHSEATGSAFVVLLAVADAANARGERSCQSVETLAHMARVSVRTVQRALRDLEALGELENDGQDSRYSSNVYRFPALAGAGPGPRPVPTPRGDKLAPLTDSGVTHVTPGVTNEAARGDIAVSPNPIHPTLPNGSDPINAAPAAESDPEADAFARFWEAYPRKVGKGQAVKAWKAAVRKVGEDAILAGLQAHRVSLAAREPRFVPHPATWLNGERWADEPEPVALDTRTIPADHWGNGGGFLDGWKGETS